MGLSIWHRNPPENTQRRFSLSSAQRDAETLRQLLRQSGVEGRLAERIVKEGKLELTVTKEGKIMIDGKLIR